MSPALHPPRRDESTDDVRAAAAFDPFPYGAVTDGTSLPAPIPSATVTLHSIDDGPTGDPGSTACPACGAETVNGVGLFACTDCSWTGLLR